MEPSGAPGAACAGEGGQEQEPAGLRAPGWLPRSVAFLQNPSLTST